MIQIDSLLKELTQVETLTSVVSYEIIIFILNFSYAYASTNSYDLKMALSLNGSPVSSPRLIVKEGETATYTEKTKAGENFIEVTATEGTVQNHRGIMMKFVVGTIDINGKKSVISEPQVLAKDNEPAQITIGKKGDSPPQISLSVIAKRKVL